MMANRYGPKSMTSGGQVKFSMVMPPDLLKLVDDLSSRKRTKRSAVLRQIIELGLNTQARIDELAAQVI